MYLLILLLFAGGLVRFAVQRVDYYGDSMSPAYSDGDVLLVDKLCPGFREIKRYDVIAFRYRYREEYYVKRVVGLPGETVQIIDGILWIDGSPLEDGFGNEPIKQPRRAAKPVVLGEGEYFVLGDNRNDSSDSRDSDIANVSESQILGRVFMRIWHGSQKKTYEKIKRRSITERISPFRADEGI